MGEGWLVLALVRDERRGERGRFRRALGADERLDELVTELGLEEARQRVALVRGDVTDLDVDEVAGQIRAALGSRGVARIDAVVNCAARLAMDHAGQPDEARAELRRRNYATNVEGLRNLLAVVDRLQGAAAPPPRVRVLRPSIVVGPGSRDGYMAFLHAVRERAGVLRSAQALLRRMDVKAPFPGHPDTRIDLVDEGFVEETIVALLRRDVATLPPASGVPGDVGSVLHVSTAYVHGRRSGLLREEPLPAAELVQPENAYEASKGDAERLLLAWLEERVRAHLRERGLDEDEELVGACLADGLRINQLCAGDGVPMSELVAITLRALGWDEPEIAAIELVPPGPPLAAALESLVRRHPLVGRTARWLYEKRTPMLAGVYTNRPPGTRFDVANTTRDLAECGLTLRPRAITPDFVRQLMGLP